MSTLRYCGVCNSNVSQNTQPFCAGCGGSRPPFGWPEDVLTGRLVVAGQYRVRRRLGVGGFGMVFEVETVLGGLLRAMKVLSARFVGSTEAQQRFINEAVILDRLEHPNIARCYAIGQLEETEQPYILLELVDGQSLTTHIEPSKRNRQPFEPRRVVRLGLQISKALSAAHQMKLLHRDLKPNNILLRNAGTPNEQVKIIDFGIAKILSLGEGQRTSTIAGTPEFMAPEQFNPGTELDARLDLWQLGAVLFYLLTGFPPYRLPEGRNNAFSVHAQQHARFGMLGPAPSELIPGLGTCPELDRLVSELLSTEPQRRPNSAQEVIRRLEEIWEGFEERDAPKRPRLLELVCAQPSEGAWRTLCSYLATWPAPGELDAATTEAEGLLSHWPDDLRPMPLGWWRAPEEATPPYLRLPRTLDLSRRGLTDDDIVVLASRPELRSITHLNLSFNQIGNLGVVAIARSLYVENLQSLDLGYCEVGSAGAKALASSAQLRSLRQLLLAGNAIGAKGAAAFAIEDLPKLSHLDLRENHLETEGAAALAEGKGLLGLTHLSLRGNHIGADGATRLASSPLLARLSSLELWHNQIGPRGFSALASSPYLGQLSELGLAENQLGPEEARALAGLPHLGRLESLDLSHNPIGPDGAVALATSQRLSRVSALRLVECGLGEAGVAALAVSPYLGRLRELDLSQNDVGLSGIKVIAVTPNLGGVERLRLDGNPLGGSGAVALSSAAFEQLRWLSVASCRLEAEGLSALLGAPLWRNLTTLLASDNAAGAEGAKALSRLPQLSRLRELDLRKNRLGPDGVHSLAYSAHSDNLRRLDLSNNRLGDAGVQILARAPHLSALKDLTLSDNDLGLESARTLGELTQRLGLTRLSVAHNQLGDTGAQILAESPSLARLSVLDLEDNQLGSFGLERLLDSPHLAGLVSLNVSYNAPNKERSLRDLQAQKIELMERSFSALASKGAELVEYFYQELFARHPYVKPMFARTNMKQQRQHLLTALSVAIHSLRDPDALLATLTALGARHATYGVYPSHYYAVTSTLLDSLEHFAGPLWNEELHNAWAEGLQAISAAMMHAQHSTAKSA